MFQRDGFRSVKTLARSESGRRLFFGKPMRVLTVTNIYPSPENPTQGTFVKVQVESLRKLGVEMDVFKIKSFASDLEYLWAMGRLRKAMRGKNYDLVHAHFGLSGFVACAQRRAPLIVSFLGDDLLGQVGEDGKYTMKGRLFFLLSQACHRMASASIVKSEEMSRKLPGCTPVRIIPSGVNMEVFSPMPIEEAKRTLGLDQGADYLLFAAVNPSEPRKNYPLFQKTVSEARRISGRDVRELVLRNTLHEEVPLYMNAASAMVFTSFHEGSPNVVKEAMACNTPVVSLPVGTVAVDLEAFGVVMADNMSEKPAYRMPAEIW